jgi:hypothetical protein
MNFSVPRYCDVVMIMKTNVKWTLKVFSTAYNRFILIPFFLSSYGQIIIKILKENLIEILIAI